MLGTRSIRALKAIKPMSVPMRTATTINPSMVHIARKSNTSQRACPEIYHHEDQHTVTLSTGQSIYIDSRIDFSAKTNAIDTLKNESISHKLQQGFDSYFSTINADQFAITRKSGTDELMYNHNGQSVRSEIISALRSSIDAKVDDIELIVPHDGLCTSTHPIKTADGVCFELSHQLAYQLRGNAGVTDETISSYLSAWKTEIESLDYCALKWSSKLESPFKLVTDAKQFALLFECSHVLTADNTILENYLKDFPQLVHISESKVDTMVGVLIMGLCWQPLAKFCQSFALSQVMSEIKEGKQSIGRSAQARYKDALHSIGTGTIMVYVSVGLVGLLAAANIIRTRADMLIVTGIVSAICGLPYGLVMLVVLECNLPYREQLF